MNCPGKAVIAGSNNGGVSIATILVGNVSRTVRANLDVAVQAAAISQRVNRDSGAIAEAAIQAHRTGGVNDILRAVIDCVLVANRRRQLGHGAGSKGTAANGLMINARGHAAANRRGETCAVTV